MEEKVERATALVKATMRVLEAAGRDATSALAFAKVFDYLAGEPEASTDNGIRRGHDADTPARATTGDQVDRLASRLGLPRPVVEQVFFFEGTEIDLLLPVSSVPSAKSRATEEIALLVAAGRQGSGLDEDGWTSVNPIRSACENYKRYDQANFATTIKEMGDLFTVRGSGRDRKVRMTAPAWQKARDLVMSVTEGRS